MKKRYCWKKLSTDGLMKEPEDVGASYESESVNGWDSGFESEKDAIEHMKHLGKRLGVDGPYILITEYYF